LKSSSGSLATAALKVRFLAAADSTCDGGPRAQKFKRSENPTCGPQEIQNMTCVNKEMGKSGKKMEEVTDR
jgi:hypothetical protein